VLLMGQRVTLLLAYGLMSLPGQKPKNRLPSVCRYAAIAYTMFRINNAELRDNGLRAVAGRLPLGASCR
jgi:hypothetical protein